MPEKVKHPRDDDDAEDGWDHDPTALVGVDIYNTLGVIVAHSAATPGVAAATVLLPAAGNYTARVRNLGFTSAAPTPKLVVREPWDQ